MPMEFLLSLVVTTSGGLLLAGILAALRSLFRKSKPQVEPGAPAAERSIRASMREQLYLRERRRDEIDDDIESLQNQRRHLDLDIREARKRLTRLRE